MCGGSHTHTNFYLYFILFLLVVRLVYCTSSTLHMLTVNLCGLLYMLKFMHFLESLTRASLLKYHNRKIIHEIEKHTAVTVVTQTLFTIFISLSFCSHMLCVCVYRCCVCIVPIEVKLHFVLHVNWLYFFYSSFSSLMRSFTNWFSFFFFFYRFLFKIFFFFDSRSTEFCSHFTEFHNNCQFFFFCFSLSHRWAFDDNKATRKNKLWIKFICRKSFLRALREIKRCCCCFFSVC